MEDVEIRRVRPDEWEHLRELRLRALSTDPVGFGATFYAALEDDDAAWRARADRPNGATFVAVEPDGHFVGMASGGPAPNRADAGGVYGMWVAPEARGQALGAALLDAVEAWARQTGYELIGLGVTTTNEPAIRLYEAQGYTVLGQRHPLREDSDLMIQLMGKSLDGSRPR